MSQATVEYAQETGLGISIADPKPAFCSNCHRGADENLRFVAFPGSHDSGAFVNPPAGEYVIGSDDLFLCEPCVKSAGEIIAFKPELHTAQRQHIRRVEAAVEHWQDYAKTLEATLQERPERAPGAIKRA